MKNHDNEKTYIESILNLKDNLKAAQKTIKENFNIDTYYDEATSTMHILNENNRNCIKAKDYLLENIGSDKIQILYGKQRIT